MKMYIKTMWISLFLSATVWAEGLVLQSTALSTAQVQTLSSSVAKAKTQFPREFDAVRQIVLNMPKWDAKKRGRLAPIGMMIDSIGDNRLFPILSVLVLESPTVTLTPSAELSLKIGFIESLGRLKDERASSVLLAILKSPQKQLEVYRSAAEALGRTQSEASATALVQLSKQNAPSQWKIVSGMGSCRHLLVAERLAALAESAKTDESRVATIKGLKEIGNAWAWKTEKSKTQEMQVRALSAKALLQLFIRGNEDIRQAASNALMVVDDASTPQLIAVAKTTADASTQQALVALEQRFAQNPTR